jgi:hypothetical protein
VLGDGATFGGFAGYRGIQVSFKHGRLMPIDKGSS